MKRALLYMHLAVLLWGFTGVLGLAIEVDAPVLVWYRMAMTALFMGVIVTYRRQWLPIGKQDMKTLISVGCLIGVHWVAFYASIKFSTASIALVCLSSSSLFTALLDPLLNRTRVDVVEVLLGILALSGVYLIYHVQEFYAMGILFGVIAAALSSVFTILNKRVAHKYPARTLVFWEMSTGLVLVTLIIGALMSAGLEQYLVSPDKPEGSGLTLFPSGYDWLWLVLLSLCCTVWAQSLALTALRKLSSFTASFSVNLEPIYGIILAFAFFQENKKLTWGFYAGVGIILLSVALQTARLLRPATGKVEDKSGIEQ